MADETKRRGPAPAPGVETDVQRAAWKARQDILTARDWLSNHIDEKDRNTPQSVAFREVLDSLTTYLKVASGEA